MFPRIYLLIYLFICLRILFFPSKDILEETLANIEIINQKKVTDSYILQLTIHDIILFIYFANIVFRI